MTEFNIIADASSEYKLSIKTNLIALDGAAEFLRTNNIVPSVIIGDFDKVTKSTLEYFSSKGVKIIQDLDQNSTDLDKGIGYCISNGATIINIHNALGGRLDHTLYNTRILKKYYNPNLVIKIFNTTETMQYFENSTIEVTGNLNSMFSLLSAPSAIITSSGLEYDMQDYSLEFGKSESSSNSLKYTTAIITINGYAFAIYDIQSQIKNLYY